MSGVDFSRKVIGPVTFETGEAGVTAGTGLSPLADKAGSGVLVAGDSVEISAGALCRTAVSGKSGDFATTLEELSSLPVSLGR